MSILPPERQMLIRERLAADGRVLAGDLARELGTSEDTIRRDLRDMAAAGLCRRVYGGALPLSPSASPIIRRERENPELKRRLAEAAAGLIQPGQTLLIDAGSTNAAIARALPEHAGITVVTNAPLVAAAITGRPGFELILIGGRVDGHAGGCIGASAVRDLSRFRADIAIPGACALGDGGDISVFSYEEADFKIAMAKAATMVLVAITSEKIGTSAPYPILSGGEIDHLVVEHDVSPAVETLFHGLKATLHRASASS